MDMGTRSLATREFVDYKTSMIADEDPHAGVVALPGSRFLPHTTRSYSNWPAPPNGSPSAPPTSLGEKQVY